MVPTPERTAFQWFQEAARRYVEGHQACAWCGGSHRVFRSERAGRLEYFCFSCEFYACHDRQSDSYLAGPGQVDSPSSSPTLADAC